MNNIDEKIKLTRDISFHFHPFKFEKGEHAIEKNDGTGVKRKYLRGISSGIMRDGAGERMTLACIESMMKQGNSGNVLLFAGLHGVNFINDLGILTHSEIVNKTNWLTEYKLHDELDEMPQETVGRAMKLWKQCRGLPPYKKPIQKGFSVEGVVPEDQILEKKIEPDGKWSHRVINDIMLDGVLVCSRPAYQDSVVTAVYKCLGELAPEMEENVRKNYQGELIKTINENKEASNFYQKYFEVNAVFEDKISEIMKFNDNRKTHRLDILFDEYKTVLKNLILQNAGLFEVTTKSGKASDEKAETRQQLMKQLAITARQFSNSILKRIGG